MFSGIEKAKASFDAAYMNEGHYLCRIDRVKADKNRSGDHFLAVEMTVIHTYADGDGKPESWHKPGDAVSHLMMSKHDSFLGNVKAMIANLLGVHESEVSEKDCETASGPNQPLAGMVAEVRARGILTRQQKPFTKITYVREFPASEIQDTIDAKMLAAYFPGDTLDKMIEREAEGS
jgi:hypothetical protein